MSTPEKVCNAAWHGNWQNDEGTIPDANPMHGKTFADAKAQAYARSAPVSTFNRASDPA